MANRTIEDFLRHPLGEGQAVHKDSLLGVPGMTARGRQGLVRARVMTMHQLVGKFLLLDADLEAFGEFLVTKASFTPGEAVTTGHALRRLTDRMWQPAR